MGKGSGGNGTTNQCLWGTFRGTLVGLVIKDRVREVYEERKRTGGKCNKKPCRMGAGEEKCEKIVKVVP